MEGPGFDSTPPFGPGSGMDPIPGSGMAGDPLVGTPADPAMQSVFDSPQGLLSGGSRRRNVSRRNIRYARHPRLSLAVFIVFLAIFVAIAVIVVVGFSSNQPPKSFSQQNFPSLNGSQQGLPSVNGAPTQP